DYAPLAAHDRGEVDARVAGFDAERRRLSHEMSDLGAAQQRLGRHAAAQDAKPGQRRRGFDDHDRSAQRAGYGGGRIARASGADHAEIELLVDGHAARYYPTTRRPTSIDARLVHQRVR